MISFLEIILYFFVYSFIGWVCESIYCSIGSKQIINRGFLNGPVCPVYGFGALIVLFFLRNHQSSIIEIFIYGMILTSVLEYITGYLLEVIFKTTWWDYSHKRFNIKGRVCLQNSIMFGIMSIVLIEIIHKRIAYYISLIPTNILSILVVINVIWITIDFIFTTISMNKIDTKLKTLDDLLTELKRNNIYIDKFDEESLSKLLENLKLRGNVKLDKYYEINKMIYSIKSKSINQRRLLNSFPNMKHKYKQEIFMKLKDIIKNNTDKLK